MLGGLLHSRALAGVAGVALALGILGGCAGDSGDGASPTPDASVPTSPA